MATSISAAVKSHLREEIASFLQHHPASSDKEKGLLCMDLLRAFTGAIRHGRIVSQPYSQADRTVLASALVGHRVATSNEGIRITIALRTMDGAVRTQAYLYKVLGLTDETRVCGSFDNDQCFWEVIYFYDLEAGDAGANMSEWEAAIRNRSATGDTTAKWVETQILGREPQMVVGNHRIQG
jgi:hypothetical protein